MALFWGWVALVALLLFMAPSSSFFGEPEYQRWKWLHRLSGITVAFALIHTFLLNRMLPGIWGVLTWTPHDEQLANVVDEEHPYTLSSSPEEPVLRIAIKALGDSSHAIQSIRPDTLVSVEGPYGRFFPGPEAGSEPELWIGGSIGITPFLARLRAHLTYCVQDETRQVYGEELANLMELLPDSALHPHRFYRQGPLDLAFIKAHCPDFAQRTAYSCGPTPLIALAEHDTPEDCWMAIEGKVYDFSAYIPNHAAPPVVMTMWCGKEATE